MHRSIFRLGMDTSLYGDIIYPHPSRFATRIERLEFLASRLTEELSMLKDESLKREDEKDIPATASNTPPMLDNSSGPNEVSFVDLKSPVGSMRESSILDVTSPPNLAGSLIIAIEEESHSLDTLSVGVCISESPRLELKEEGSSLSLSELDSKPGVELSLIALPDKIESVLIRSNTSQIFTTKSASIVLMALVYVLLYN